MTGYIKTNDINKGHNITYAFFLNYASDILCKQMVEMLNNNTYIANNRNFNLFITSLDFLHNLCSNIYLNICQKPRDYSHNHNIETDQRWKKRINTSGNLKYLDLIKLPKEIFDSDKSHQYILSYYTIQEEFSTIYKGFIEIADEKLNEFQNLKIRNLKKLLNASSSYEHDFIKFVKALLNKNGNTKDSLISKLNSITTITSRNINAIREEFPKAIKMANIMFLSGKLHETEEIDRELKNANINVKYLTFGTEFNKPSGEYGYDAPNISILEDHELHKFIKIIQNNINIIQDDISNGIEKICNKINDYHTQQGFMYPLLDRCLDKDGCLRKEDEEAMKIIHTLWTLIYHDIQNNTLNASKTKDTEGRRIYTKSYMHIVLYQKLVDYIKYQGLDKDDVDEEISRFVKDVSNAYGSNTPELEIDEMNYRKSCKTLLEECAKEIIESKPPISQILFSYLNDIDTLNTLVISYVLESAKSIYMPKELKKFYTYGNLRDIIAEEEQKPDSYFQNMKSINLILNTTSKQKNEDMDTHSKSRFK